MASNVIYKGFLFHKEKEDFMDYITTYTGKNFRPLNPEMSQIDIRDIAHALSLTCRGNGHVKNFFSVGQHCVYCAKEAEARGYSSRVILGCLLHDASEAYLAHDFGYTCYMPINITIDNFTYLGRGAFYIFPNVSDNAFKNNYIPYQVTQSITMKNMDKKLSVVQSKGCTVLNSIPVYFTPKQ